MFVGLIIIGTVLVFIWFMFAVLAVCYFGLLIVCDRFNSVVIFIDFVFGWFCLSSWIVL